MTMDNGQLEGGNPFKKGLSPLDPLPKTFNAGRVGVCENGRICSLTNGLYGLLVFGLCNWLALNLFVRIQ